MHKESILICKDPSLTIQSFDEAQNIDNIIKNYERTGFWSTKPLSEPTPLVGDFSDVPSDYLALCQYLSNASRSFDLLPDRVRNSFGSPGELLNFLDTNPSPDDLYRVGLIDKMPSEPQDGAPEQPVQG